MRKNIGQIHAVYHLTELIMKKVQEMKESYVAPEVKIIEMEVAHVIAASVLDEKDFQNGGYYGRGSMRSSWPNSNVQNDFLNP